MQQQIKLMADYDCWALWWAGDHEPGNIDPATLPLSAETVARLNQWSDAFDATLNRADPAVSGFATEQARNEFEQAGIMLWQQLRQELPPDYTVLYYSLQRRATFVHPEELTEAA